MLKVAPNVRLLLQSQEECILLVHPYVPYIISQLKYPIFYISIYLCGSMVQIVQEVSLFFFLALIESAIILFHFIRWVVINILSILSYFLAINLACILRAFICFLKKINMHFTGIYLIFNCLITRQKQSRAGFATVSMGVPVSSWGPCSGADPILMMSMSIVFALTCILMVRIDSFKHRRKPSPPLRSHKHH